VGQADTAGMKHLLLLALVFPVIALAQVQKCQIEGKTVYSDSLCGQTGVTINATANSLDTSGMCEQTSRAKAKAASEAEIHRVAEAKQRKADQNAAGDAALKKSSEGFIKSYKDLGAAYNKAIRLPGN
jgi:hypothetical protein